MDCILVVVDRFSKYSHFLALSHPFSAAKVAKLFLDNIYKLHGMPDSIVSDRDRVFTSTLAVVVHSHKYPIVHEFSIPSPIRQLDI
jgi:hypothetical protein